MTSAPNRNTALVGLCGETIWYRHNDGTNTAFADGHAWFGQIRSLLDNWTYWVVTWEP